MDSISVLLFTGLVSLIAYDIGKFGIKEISNSIIDDPEPVNEGIQKSHQECTPDSLRFNQYIELILLVILLIF